ncbi:hypothetical protein [Micromonospora sp. M71_S20]|uniref:hypothetical protein n=1 Tax=Micromonospora sp. M71_S20 TaxID=592872 RepID=UPI000EAB6487|nr:hypothetical protein [Micromonospora sp. M71_S20]
MLESRRSVREHDDDRPITLDQLLPAARDSAGATGNSQVLVVVTARSGRLMWKYEDFDSWFLVQGLVAAVRRPATAGISFDEALPDPMAPGTGPEHHVSELVIDVAGAD